MESWIKDDPGLSGASWIYRRIRRIPEHYVPIDPISGKPRITNATLTYRGDGMSIAVGDLLTKEGLAVTDLADSSSHTIARCQISDVREADGGVVTSVDAADLNQGRGRAHGLVRTDEPPPDRQRWIILRDSLRRRMSVLDDQQQTWTEVA